MSVNPWHKRYHGDALAGYMNLTLEERGAYTTLLDLMYDRRAPLSDNIRLLAGYLNVSMRKAESVLESLIRKRKIYRLEDGSISNPRFEKEVENALETARKLAENGSKGGRNRAENNKSPNKNNEENSAGLDVASSLPEARSQRPESRKKKESSLPIGREGTGLVLGEGGLAPVQPTELTLAVQAFNEAADQCPGTERAAGFSKCLSLNATREKQLRARLKEVALDGWRAAMTRAARSDFLAGRARRKPGHERWGVDLTWLSKAENFTKLIEGKYDNDRARVQLTGRDSGRAGLMDFLADQEGKGQP